MPPQYLRREVWIPMYIVHTIYSDLGSLQKLCSRRRRKNTEQRDIVRQRKKAEIKQEEKKSIKRSCSNTANCYYDDVDSTITRLRTVCKSGSVSQQHVEQFRLLQRRHRQHWHQAKASKHSTTIEKHHKSRRHFVGATQAELYGSKLKQRSIVRDTFRRYR